MKWYYYVLTALYCALIFMLSSRPDLPDTGAIVPSGDKLAHMIAFGGLAGLISVGIRRSNDTVSPTVQWLVPIAFAACYGLADEIHQYFVPDRTFDPWDWIADAAGAVVVQWILCRWWWSIPYPHETPA